MPHPLARSRSRASVVVGIISAGLMSVGGVAQARITGVTIGSRTSPAFGGAQFGNVGGYEQLDGTATGELDPNDPRNAVITDIALAPRNAAGMVDTRWIFRY